MRYIVTAKRLNSGADFRDCALCYIGLGCIMDEIFEDRDSDDPIDPDTVVVETCTE